MKKIIEELKISAFDIWRVIISFSRAFSKIPTPIKRHLFELELLSLFELCWLEGSPIIEIIMDESSNSSILSNLDNEISSMRQLKQENQISGGKYSTGKDSVYEKSTLTLSHEVIYFNFLLIN